ncbi:MAG: DUF2953 domain-containing protein [Firmicutes bacterium]|nr:DUF2953 domain-containing protein [Bacillota bacterium]
MGILLTIGLAVLIGLLLPVKLCLNAANDGELHIVFKVSYGFGFIAYDYNRHGRNGEAVVRVLGRPVQGSRPPEKDTPGQRGKKQEQPRGLRWLKKLRPYIPDITKDLVNSVMEREASVRIKLGFEDPAYTGMAAGLMSCITGGLGGKVQYIPDFSGENFELDLRIFGVIIPVALLFIGIKYLMVYLWDRIPEGRNVKGGRRYEFNG